MFTSDSSAFADFANLCNMALLLENPLKMWQD